MKGHVGGAWRRRTGPLLIAAVLAVGGMVAVAPQPASAVPACNGNGCNGKDPVSTACSTGDPTTTRTRFSHTVDDMYTYQLKFSTTCEATWGRFVRSDCNYPNGVHRWLKVETQLWTPYGWYPHKTQIDDMWGETTNCNGGAAWTPMAPAQEGTRARLGWGSSTSSSPPSSWSYSGWYNGGAP